MGLDQQRIERARAYIKKIRPFVSLSAMQVYSARPGKCFSNFANGEEVLDCMFLAIEAVLIKLGMNCQESESRNVDNYMSEMARDAKVIKINPIEKMLNVNRCLARWSSTSGSALPDVHKEKIKKFLKEFFEVRFKD